MYLLNVRTLQLERFLGNEVPAYAILSHTWGHGEILFRDIWQRENAEIRKEGFAKVRSCCQLANIDNLDYVWIDTCCIDSDSSAELSEAINSMYQWYQDSKICYAYLSDVGEGQKTFKESRWFSRGWTLQELLASTAIRFFNHKWSEIGSKSSLHSALLSATGVRSEHLDRPRVSSRTYSAVQ